MDLALINGRVLTDRGLEDGLAVRAARRPHRRRRAAPPSWPPALRRRDLAGGLLLPGFIDIQVNGGGGVLFNDAPTAADHRRHRPRRTGASAPPASCRP